MTTRPPARTRGASTPTRPLPCRCPARPATASTPERDEKKTMRPFLFDRRGKATHDTLRDTYYILHTLLPTPPLFFLLPVPGRWATCSSLADREMKGPFFYCSGSSGPKASGYKHNWEATFFSFFSGYRRESAFYCCDLHFVCITNGRVSGFSFHPLWSKCSTSDTIKLGHGFPWDFFVCILHI